VTRSQAPAVLLATLRAVGAGAFVAPGVGARTFGIPDDAEGKYLVRLFAARNVAFAGGLLASRGDARRLVYQAGIACDVLDIGAGLIGFKEGKERSSAIVDTAASLVATALGVAGLMADGKGGRRR
jgi:hypothetical protein